MELFQGLLLITSIHLLAAASPGPDFVLVSQQTLSNGKKTGLLTSFGIALGLSVHIIYSSFGLALVIANSEALLWVIKILGGAYLIYLGIQGLKAKATTITSNTIGYTQTKVSGQNAIIKGFFCNALNPKAPVYFVALFTMVLSPDMPIHQLAIYGGWMMVLQFSWFAAVTILLSQPAVNKKFQRLGHWIDRILGGAMILMGIKVLTSKLS